MSFTIRRGQDVDWRITMLAGGVPADMTGGAWSVVESTFVIPPTLVNGSTEARIQWTSDQTTAMKTGRKKVRLAFTPQAGKTKALPDLWIAVL